MKQTIRHKWKAVLAVVCAFVMLFNLAGGNWFGQLPAEEVQAAEAQVPTNLADMKELSWQDYGVAAETKVCITLNATTTAETFKGKDLSIRFYQLSDETSIDAMTFVEEKVVMNGTDTILELPISQFMVDEVVPGFMMGLFDGPQYADGLVNGTMDVTIKKIEVVGASNQSVDLSKVTAKQGLFNGALNNIGTVTTSADSLKLLNTICWAGVEYTFSEKIDPTAVPKVEPTLHMTVNVSTDDTNLNGQTKRINFLKYDATTNVNDAKLFEANIAFDGKDHEIAIPLTQKFFDENLLNGLGVWFVDGPAYNSGKYLTVTIKKLEVVANISQNIPLNAMSVVTYGYNGIHGTGSWGYDNEIWKLTGAIEHTGTKITFNSPVDITATAEKKIQMNMKVTGTDASKKTEIRFYNHDLQTTSIGGNGPAYYEVVYVPADGENKQIELPADKFLTDGNVNGIGIGIFSETNSGDTIEIESIKVIGEEATNINLQDCTWNRPGYAGFNGNGSWSWTGTAEKWSGYNQYSGTKVSFGSPASIKKVPMVKFRILAEKEGATGNETVSLWMMNNATQGALGNAQHLVLECQSGVAKEYTLPLSFFQNAEGALDGFKVGVFTEGKWDLEFSEVSILGGEHADLADASCTTEETGLSNANYSGTSEKKDSSIVLKSKAQYSVFQVGFTAVSAEGTSGKKTYSLGETTSFNNTVFNADVTFAEGGEFYYGAADAGLVFSLVGDKLKIDSDAYSLEGQVAGEYDAQLFGISSFANTKVNLKIATADLNASKTSATMCVWINNVLVGNGAFSLVQTVSGVHAIDGTICLTDGNLTTAKSSYGMSIVVPTDLENVTWEDFGVACLKTHKIEENPQIENYQLLSGDLNNTLFDGDIQMTADSHIRYAGSTGDFGLHIRVSSDDRLVLNSDTCTLGLEKTSYAPETLGMSTFINTRFNLKIAVKQLEEKTATIGVWINNQILGDYFTLTCGEQYNPSLGKCLSLRVGTFTPYSVITKPELAKVSLDDWKKDVKADGILDAMELEGTETDKVSTLVNTSFEETFLFAGPTDDSEGRYLFGYGGLKDNENAWYGLRIIFKDDKLILKVDGVSDMPVYTLDPETAGVTFVGDEYDWKIDTVEYHGHVLVYMYFNGQLYGNGPMVFPNYADKMGNRLMNYFFPMIGTEQQPKPAHVGGTDKNLAPYYHNLDEGEYTVPSGLTGIQKRTGVTDEDWEDIEVTGGQSLSEIGDYKINYNDGISVYSTEVILYRPGCVNRDAQSGKDLQRTALQLVKILKAINAGAVPKSEFKCETKAYDVNVDGAFDTEKNTSVNVDALAMRSLIVGLKDDSAVMPIVGYRGPSTAQTTEDVYKLIQGIGINQIIQYENGFSDNAPSRYSVYQQLSLASKYNLKMTVKDERLMSNPKGFNKETLADTMKDYSGYQSFNGLYMIDEPGDKTIYPTIDTTACTLDDDIKYLAKLVNENDIFANGNLIPYKYGYVSKRTAQYKYVQYLEKYVENFGAKFISYTRYPFWKHGSQQDKDEGITVPQIKGYFVNLALARYVAGKKGITFRSFVQTGEGFEDASTLQGSASEPNPSEGEFKWNANTALAFGAKGIQYFTLVQPTTHADYADSTPASGLIDKNGNKTCWYDYAVEVNKQIAAVDEVLMNAKSDGVMATDGYAKTNAYDNVKEIKLYTKSWGGETAGTVNATVSDNKYHGVTVESRDTGYGALTGCFEITGGKYKGKHALYIVNFNPESSNMITVNFTDGATTATYIMNGETMTETGVSVSKTLGAGEAVLVVY